MIGTCESYFLYPDKAAEENLELRSTVVERILSEIISAERIEGGALSGPPKILLGTTIEILNVIIFIFNGKAIVADSECQSIRYSVPNNEYTNNP